MVQVLINTLETDPWALHTRSHLEPGDLDQCARWVLRWARPAARARPALWDHRWGPDHDPSHQQDNDPSHRQDNDLSHQRSDLNLRADRAHPGLNPPTVPAGDLALLDLLACSKNTDQASTVHRRILPRVLRVLLRVLLRERSQESQCLVRRIELVVQTAHRQARKSLGHLVCTKPGAGVIYEFRRR